MGLQAAMLELLARHGADMTATTIDGRTPSGNTTVSV